MSGLSVSMCQLTLTKTHPFIHSVSLNSFPNCCSAGAVLLAEPVCEAASNARTAFLKCEAFRMLGGMIPANMSKGGVEVDEVDDETQMQMNALKTAFPRLLGVVDEAVKNDEMNKSKRIRDILKTASKWLSYGVTTKVFDADSITAAESTIASLKVLAESSGSSNVKSGCTAALTKLNEYTETAKKEASSVSEAGSNTTPKQGKKKGKNKKKNKKKGKK